MLRIERKDALIGIETKRPQLSIEQPRAELEMSSKQSKLEMHKDQIKIKIDQKQCFNEAGRKDPATFAREAAAEGAQAVVEGIGRIVDEGNRMADVTGSGNAIAEIALSNTSRQVDFNIDFIPKSKPVIDFVGGNLDIRVDEGSLEIRIKPSKPVISAEMGEVNIFLRQKPELHIEFVGNSIDKKV